MKKFSLFTSTIVTIAIATSTANVQAEEPAPALLPDGPAYNPNEERGSFELIMKPYPIPVETTTYVDFVFNLPDNLPDLFHVVFGEVINSQPLHLHHFVLTGCSNKIDPAKEGEAFVEYDENMERDCVIPLGGWAPGADMFGIAETDIGFLMGKGLGVQAVRINVHYTDGVYEDEATLTQKMATDGIRIHYTPDFRPYTSTQQSLLGVAFAPSAMNIPPGEDRFYITRSCKVKRSCQDTSEDELNEILEGYDMSGIGLTCETANIRGLCNAEGEFGNFVHFFCPTSCGFCDETIGDDMAPNPMVPESYRVTGVNYHAHLLGREMYTTLIREEESTDDSSGSILREAEPTSSSSTTTMVKDLQSRQFWIYDFQETIPFGYDYVVDENTVLQGTEIKVGDKIQVTCVYDSSARTDPTIFDVSTYDEMCITTVLVTFPTPSSLLSSGNATEGEALYENLGLFMELRLHTFDCESDESGDIHTGVLAEGEDGRDIWKDHPIDQTEGCTFRVSSMVLGDGVYQPRTCPESVSGVLEGESFLCEEKELFGDAIAGALCVGGTHDDSDANGGLTEEECVDGGGEWNPYTCESIDYWLQYEAGSSGITHESLEYIRIYWYQPNCCLAEHEDETEDETESTSEDSPVAEDSSTLETGAENSVSAAPGFRGILTVASTAAAIVLAMAL